MSPERRTAKRSSLYGVRKGSVSGLGESVEVRTASTTVFSPVRMCGRRGASCGSRYNVRRCGTIDSRVRLARDAEGHVRPIPS